jgi:5-methylcytosine-specific restriction protein A
MPDGSSRPSAQERGYGWRWQQRRELFLTYRQACALCGARSTVADHYPRTRRQLVADGVADPDAYAYLRPLCRSCHDRHGPRTKNWGNRARPLTSHPGVVR